MSALTSIGTLSGGVLPIPADAPFSEEQRTWLAGFQAGFASRLVSTALGGGAGDDTRTRVSLQVLYGSQTGNAEEFALDAVSAATGAGFSATAIALDDVDVADLASAGRILLITSTYGEGEMPDNAELFWEALSATTAPRLDGLVFSVLALGDSSYDGYCQAGKLIDTRLEQLGGLRIAARVDCDVDFEDDAAQWLTLALATLAEREGVGADASPAPAAATAGRTRSQWTRKNPYTSTLAVSRRLSGAGSAKEIRHYEFDLADSGITYEAGDALGVVPQNDPALVTAILERLEIAPDDICDGVAVPVGVHLTEALEIRAPSRELVAEIAARHPGGDIAALLRLGDKERLDSWLWGKDLLDLLMLEPGFRPNAADVVALLKPLQHRAYSISSSPLAATGSVHLTVASVQYRGGDRLHNGVASGHLATRSGEGAAAPIFVSHNTSFRVPADNTAPMIMVGPGTGVAPFRAFLQERRERGATGRNWLFFGDQHRASDFIYEEELGRMSSDGLLTRLDLAFSRDQKEKIYVQTRMAENGKELYGWLQEGGHFYVCGDAGRMAKDVDDTLHQIVATHGGLSTQAASDYVSTLKREKRYVRDVY